MIVVAASRNNQVLTMVSNVKTKHCFSLSGNIAFSSSSVEIAEEIKILDMSMPSYGDISDYKATVTNTKSLSIDPSKEKVGLPVSTSKKSSSMSSSSGSPAASFLPSMNKKSAVDKNAEKARKYSSNPEYDF